MAVGLKTARRKKPRPDWSRPMHRFSVEQYHRMIEAGVLTTNDRVELLEGWIVEKMSQNPPHSGSVSRCNRRLGRVLTDEWIVRVQCPITLTKSEPESDIAIVGAPEDQWDLRHPGPGDIEVLMEIADSSVLTDRRDKGFLYAAAEIREFWLVNLVTKKVEVYTKPKSGKNARYAVCREYGKNESVPLVLGGETVAEIPVSDLIP